MSDIMQAPFEAAKIVQEKCIIAEVQGGSKPAAWPEHMGSYELLDNASPSCWLSFPPKLADSCAAGVVRLDP